MAPITKLYVDTKVQVKQGPRAGERGTIGDHDPVPARMVRDTDSERLFYWVWFQRKRGAWISHLNLRII